MAPVGGGPALVVDRTGGLGDQACESVDGGFGRGTGVPFDGAIHEGLGLDGTHRHRSDRSQPDPHASTGTVHDEGQGRHRDDHGVAGADLEELLGPVEHGDPHRLDQLLGFEGVLLDARDEAVQGQLAGSARRPEDDGGVEGGEHRQGVAGRRGRGEVAAEGASVADLRGADGSSGLGECGQEDRKFPAPHLRIGQSGPEHEFIALQPPTAQFVDPVDDHDVVKSDLSTVDADHEIGAARQQQGVRVLGECCTGVVEGARDGHRHGLHAAAISTICQRVRRGLRCPAWRIPSSTPSVPWPTRSAPPCSAPTN